VDQLFILVSPRFDNRAIGRLVAIRGREHLDEALSRGKGCVLVHGHFGPAHLPLVTLAGLGYAVKQVGNPSDEGLSWVGRHVAFRLRMRYERRMPTEILPAQGYLGPVFRCLKDNGVIMITGDGSGTAQRLGRHARLSFFAQPVMFPLGPALLAQKAGAPLLPMFILPETEGRFQIIIEPTINSEAGGGVEETMERFVRRLEHYVAACPWYMHFLDRFRPGIMIETGTSRPQDPRPVAE